jgi:hypothetical protein
MLQIQGLAAAAISLVHQQKSWLAQLTMLTANNSYMDSSVNQDVAGLI